MAAFLANSLSKAARTTSRSKVTVRYATTNFRMPAMSPTMTEGGISSWKFKEGDSFVTGDILVEVETDKATIDVEAQDDGIMGKILSVDGDKGIPVGQVIAILAEEGDDLASITIPSDISPPGTETPQASTSAPTPEKSEKKEEKPESKVVEAEGKAAQQGEESIGHGLDLPEGKTFFPSVMRLLAAANLSSSDLQKITSKKGSARHGMLSKGDVLFALGKIKDAKGSASKMVKTTYGVKGAKLAESTSTTPPGSGSEASKKPLTGLEMRRLILTGMEEVTKPARSIATSTNALTESLPASASITAAEFDSLLSPYSSLLAAASPPKPQTGVPAMDFLLESKGSAPAKGKVARDEWEGLF